MYETGGGSGIDAHAHARNIIVSVMYNNNNESNRSIVAAAAAAAAAAWWVEDR